MPRIKNERFHEKITSLLVIAQNVIFYFLCDVVPSEKINAEAMVGATTSRESSGQLNLDGQR